MIAPMDCGYTSASHSLEEKLDDLEKRAITSRMQLKEKLQKCLRWKAFDFIFEDLIAIRELIKKTDSWILAIELAQSQELQTKYISKYRLLWLIWIGIYNWNIYILKPMQIKWKAIIGTVKLSDIK